MLEICFLLCVFAA